MAAEKPKHAAIMQTPKPIMVSQPIDSINTTIIGNSVTNSSNIPKKLPNAMNTSVETHITATLFLQRVTTLRMNAATPPVFSITLNTPLITSKNTLIIMIVNASEEPKTRTGAVTTFQKGMPSVLPCT